MFTQDQYDVLLQQNRILYVKLELLNNLEHKIDELQGNLVDGNISIDRESDVRRTCNVTFVINNNKFIPSPSSYFWFNRKFRLLIGIVNSSNNEIVWFNMGIYIVNNPVLSLSLTDKTISIEGLDKMCLYNGTLNGTLLNPVIIPVGTNITTAIRSTLSSLGGETKFNIDLLNEVTPYTIEKNAGDTIHDIMRELADLYKDWSEIHFDINGFFVFEKIRDKNSDPVSWDFSQNNILINEQNEPSFQNIKNRIQIWGHTHEEGTTTKYLMENNDVNSPYAINKIGYRDLFVSDDNLWNNSQAEARAIWELKEHSHLNEKIDISSVPIYLDVNRVISFSNSGIGIFGRYLINSLNIPLNVSGSMSLKAYKLK